MQKSELFKEWRRRDLNDFIDYLKTFEGKESVLNHHVAGVEINFLIESLDGDLITVKANNLDFIVDKYIEFHS